MKGETPKDLGKKGERLFKTGWDGGKREVTFGPSTQKREKRKEGEQTGEGFSDQKGNGIEKKGVEICKILFELNCR